jgi:hypothetical protein
MKTYAGDAGILLLMKRKMAIGKVKSSRCSYCFVTGDGDNMEPDDLDMYSRHQQDNESDVCNIYI